MNSEIDPFQSLEWKEKVRESVTYSFLALVTIELTAQVLTIFASTRLIGKVTNPQYRYTLFVRVIFMLACSSAWAFAHFRRKTISLGLSRTLTVVIVSAQMFLIWQLSFIQQEEQFYLQPLLGAKILSVIIPSLEFDSLIFSLALFFAVQLEALLIIFLGGSQGIFRATFEPYPTLVFAAAGILLFSLHTRNRANSRELYRLKNIAQANEKIAQVFMSVRDRANTPLQTMAVSIDLLRRSGENPKIIDHLKSSLDRLISLFKEFASYEIHYRWLEESLPQSVKLTYHKDARDKLRSSNNPQIPG